MVKIGNWRVIHKDYWINTVTKDEVLITQEKEYYYVMVGPYNNRQYDNAMVNLTDARKSAIEYMKRNK